MNVSNPFLKPFRLYFLTLAFSLLTISVRSGCVNKLTYRLANAARLLMCPVKPTNANEDNGNKANLTWVICCSSLCEFDPKCCIHKYTQFELLKDTPWKFVSSTEQLDYYFRKNRVLQELSTLEPPNFNQTISMCIIFPIENSFVLPPRFLASVLWKYYQNFIKKYNPANVKLFSFVDFRKRHSNA